jgi:hypothetical protein
MDHPAGVQSDAGRGKVKLRHALEQIQRIKYHHQDEPVRSTVTIADGMRLPVPAPVLPAQTLASRAEHQLPRP